MHDFRSRVGVTPLMLSFEFELLMLLSEFRGRTHFLHTRSTLLFRCAAPPRAVGVLPGVTVHATEEPFTASLFADEYCSADTSLVFYMKSNSVVSRPFTSKDTHSTHGDLLVVYGDAKVSFVDRELAKQTTAVLGFQSPSFTFNADLFLPAGANADLREVLVSGQDPQERQRYGGVREILKGFIKLRDVMSVPQVSVKEMWSSSSVAVA